VGDPSELDAELDAGALGPAARRLAELGDANAAGLPTRAARARVRARMFEDDARPFELGRYVVLGVLGRGGMGIVYAAYDPELDRKVAIKLLQHDTSSEAQARLKREARALAKLAHPNVLSVHDVGSVVLAGDGPEHDRTRVYIAMELVDGVTLAAWLRAEPRSQRAILEMMIQAGRGLAAAHAALIVHRDFKPENVLVGRDGRPRVMDFGLARAEGERTPPEHASGGESGDEHVTATGAFVGTPAYMAPEQFLGLEIDARTDQFAFCIALCEALCGERPFAGDSVHALAMNVIEGIRRELPRSPSLPRWLQAVLERGLSRTPANRFASIDELLAVLSDDPTRRRRVRIGATAFALASVGAVGLWQLDRTRTRTACEREAHAITREWNDDVRVRVAAAMNATGLPYADASASGASAWIDRRVAAWTTAREDVCVAIELERTMDPSTAARARDCFDARRAEMAGLVAQLLAAERATVTRAVTGAARLPDPARCSDRLALARQPLVDEGARASVAVVRERLAKVWAMLATASYAPALADVELALADAETTGEPTIVAAAELLLGRAAELGGDPQRARGSLEHAVHRAGAAGADETAAEAAELLVWVLGVQLAKHELALAWAEQARMWHDRLGLAEDDPHRVTLLVHLGLVQAEQGAFADAIATDEQALAIQERVLGPDHPDVAIVLNNLGIAHAQLGDDARAVDMWRRALAIREAAFGPAHPEVAASLGNIAIALYHRGELEQAEVEQRRALAIREAALGPEHFETALSWRNLADIAVARGHHDDALAD
jgi:tetratricopeptide (TPR) repeat protein/predicted Ser/Thr protein kinase